MKIILNNIRQTFKRGNNNVIKLLLLGSGLAMGLLLIAKIYFEKTYEGFVPNAERVYRVNMVTISDNEKLISESGFTPGAIAPGIKAYCPMVELATRYSDSFVSNIVMKRISPSGEIEKGSYRANYMIYADTSFFDVFSRSILLGNPHQVMQEKNQVMISTSFAQKLTAENFESLIGSLLALDYNLTETFTIGGIFENFPKNSELAEVEIALSMPSIAFPGFDGSNNWSGNDRFVSFVRLQEGTDLKFVRESVVRMCQQNISQTKDQKVDYQIVPIQQVHSSDPNTQRICQILLMLSLAVLLASVLNYILIAISAMVYKAKTIAVHKCYGASQGNIYRMLFVDAFVQIVLSLLFAAFLIFISRDIIEDLMQCPVVDLFKGNSIYVLTAVCLFILLVCGVVPGSLYSKIPVATAFRRYKENSRQWKLWLLFLQFVASSFFICLLLIVMLQYDLVLNVNMGYSYNNVVYIQEKGVSDVTKKNIEQELARLPFVQKQSRATGVPFENMGGNGVFIGDKRLFLISDRYATDPNFFDMMEIRIIEGRTFKDDSPDEEMMVSRRFANEMARLGGWKDGVVGKQIWITEHSEKAHKFCQICGVYENYTIGTSNSPDQRPTAHFAQEFEYLKKDVHLIKLNEIKTEYLDQIISKVRELAQNNDLEIKDYTSEYRALYAENRRFKDMVLIAGLVVLLITLIGLIGYSQDEVNRRRSEIAVRKINGASLLDIFRLLLFNVLKILLPAVIVGSVITYLVAINWLEQYSQKIDLNWMIFVGSALVMGGLVITVMVLSIYRKANANPVENLKVE